MADSVTQRGSTSVASHATSSPARTSRNGMIGRTGRQSESTNTGPHTIPETAIAETSPGLQPDPTTAAPIASRTASTICSGSISTQPGRR